jgi:hypothetical protein
MDRKIFAVSSSTERSDANAPFSAGDAGSFPLIQAHYPF